jgi:AraC-like DNA-binding protein
MTKLYIKYNFNEVCKKIVQEQLDKMEIDYVMTGFAEVDVKKNLPTTKLKQINRLLNNYGIEIVESEKSILIEKIKAAITEMVYLEEKLPTTKTSHYLAKKINRSYGYISNVFSEVTYTTIENFILLQKIERVKDLITANELTFKEIAWELNYSSLAHLSTQFKNKTGLTLSAFQRIINKRRRKNGNAS